MGLRQTLDFLKIHLSSNDAFLNPKMIKENISFFISTNHFVRHIAFYISLPTVMNQPKRKISPREKSSSKMHFKAFELIINQGRHQNIIK